MAIKDQLLLHFNSIDLYDILGISKDADASQIKKAYLRKSLQCHPDKGGSVEKFHALSIVFNILKDEDLKSFYDEHSELPEEQDLNNSDAKDSEDNVIYSTSILKKYTELERANLFDKFKMEYQNTDEELEDLIKAFYKCKGEWVKIIEYIMFAETTEDVERLNTIFTKNIKKVQEYENEYVEEVDEINEDEQDDEEYFPNFYKNFKKTYSILLNNLRTNEIKKKNSKAAEKKEKKEKDSFEALTAKIKENSKNRNSFLDSLEAKYANVDKKKRKKNEIEDPLDDEEFERIQKNMVKNKRSK